MSVIKQKHMHVQTLFSLQLWQQQVHVVSAVDEYAGCIRRNACLRAPECCLMHGSPVTVQQHSKLTCARQCPQQCNHAQAGWPTAAWQ